MACLVRATGGRWWSVGSPWRINVRALCLRCGSVCLTLRSCDLARLSLLCCLTHSHRYVHSLRIFVDTTALGEFEVWISDDNALMTTAYDATGGLHIVCAGPDTVDGLTAFVQSGPACGGSLFETFIDVAAWWGSSSCGLTMIINCVAWCRCICRVGGGVVVVGGGGGQVSAAGR